MALVQGNASGIISLPDQAQNQQAALDRQSGLLVSETHGKYFAASRAGRLFISTTIIAGKAIPLAAGTLAATGLTIHNPSGSGVICEPVAYTLGLDSATIIVNTIGLLIQRNLTGTSGIPTSTTAAYTAPLGISGNAACSVYTVATLTNVAVPGVTAATAVPIPLYPMFTFAATAAAWAGELTHCFDGKLLLGPDSLASSCTTVTGGQTAAFAAIIWAEWPI
jgi:hypothetical protein